MGCLAEDTVLLFVQRRLGERPQREVHEHIARCPDCRAAVAAAAEDDEADAAVSNEPTSPHAVAPSEGHATTLPSGSPVGRYRLLDLIGAGGMGVVYTAHDPQLDRKIALKLVRRERGEDAAERRHVRLLREAKAMARLAHPNVVHVYDAGTIDGQVFVAMELVEGRTLKHWLAEARPWRDVVRLFGEAGRGLAAAHDKGLIHRDFKPDNVMVGLDGRARVTDFGLARHLTHEEGEEPTRPGGTFEVDWGFRTRTGILLGTPAYMAPEQLEGRPVDARTDQFSFCVGLYEAIYARRPFEVGSLDAMISAMRSPPAQPPSTGAPPALWEVMRRGLSWQAEERFPSMDALLEALAAAAEGRVRPSSRRWLAAASLLGIAGIGAAGVVLWHPRARPAASPSPIAATGPAHASLELEPPASIATTTAPTPVAPSLEPQPPAPSLEPHPPAPSLEPQPPARDTRIKPAPRTLAPPRTRPPRAHRVPVDAAAEHRSPTGDRVLISDPWREP